MKISSIFTFESASFSSDNLSVRVSFISKLSKINAYQISKALSVEIMPLNYGISIDKVSFDSIHGILGNNASNKQNCYCNTFLFKANIYLGCNKTSIQFLLIVFVGFLTQLIFYLQ